MGAFGDLLQKHFGGTRHDVSTWGRKSETPKPKKQYIQTLSNDLKNTIQGNHSISISKAGDELIIKVHYESAPTPIKLTEQIMRLVKVASRNKYNELGTIKTTDLVEGGFKLYISLIKST